MKIAITGGIGSGKSYVCNMLRKQGIEIYDCDSSAKHLMCNSDILKERLKKAIGEEVYFSDGSLNKAYISRFLLSSPKNTEIINGIVHPAVAEHFELSGKQWMECAILLESGFNKLVDKIICVVAPLEIRIQRVMQRDNISRQQAIEWISKQIPQERLMSQCDYCIQNDGKSDLTIQINNILNLIKTLN